MPSLSRSNGHVSYSPNNRYAQQSMSHVVHLNHSLDHQYGNRPCNWEEYAKWYLGVENLLFTDSFQLLENIKPLATFGVLWRPNWSLRLDFRNLTFPTTQVLDVWTAQYIRTIQNHSCKKKAADGDFSIAQWLWPILPHSSGRLLARTFACHNAQTPCFIEWSAPPKKPLQLHPKKIQKRRQTRCYIFPNPGIEPGALRHSTSR